MSRRDMAAMLLSANRQTTDAKIANFEFDSSNLENLKLLVLLSMVQG